MKIFGVIALILAVIGGAFLFVYWGMYDKGVVHEAGIEAQVKQNQNKYSAFTSKVVEQMGVAKEYQKAVADVIQKGIEGRFGEGGSKAMFQAFSEAYPATLDPDMFRKVQLSIESGRDDFAAEQKMLISKVQAYQTDLNMLWSGMWMKQAGFPRIDLTEAKYNPVVSSQTKEVFTTGTDTGIKF